MSHGYHRLGSPNVERGAIVCTFVSEREVIDVMALHSDPFQIDDPCPFAPDRRHFGIGCGEVACFYCTKIFTR